MAATFFNTSDVRYNSYHIIRREANKWSTEWSAFPGIPYTFSFESGLLPHADDIHEFTQKYWYYSMYISFGYIATVIALKKWMDSRQTGFNLRAPLAFWSTTLALISIFGVVRCLPEFVHVLTNQGFEASFSYATYYKDCRLMFWYLVFTLSKATELIDTLFIVLRKQKLIALHWIHHTLTLCYSWYVFGDVPATARWMVNMNFMIHSLMYSYYALKAVRISIRRFVNVSITTLQILQMVFGVCINGRALQLKLTGRPCDLSLSVAVYGLAIYSLFFSLFLNYFWRTYLAKSPKTSKSATNGVAFADKPKAIANGAVYSDINHNKVFASDHSSSKNVIYTNGKKHN